MGEKRVLLVDDNPSDRKIVRTVTERNGFLATEVEDGFKALEALNEEQFALFIVDLQMPKMPGLQLVKRLRSNPDLAKTPILITSARNRPVDVVSAVQTGANDYIVKPMDIQVLEEKINRLSKGAGADWKLYQVPEESRTTQVGLFMQTMALNEIGAEVVSNMNLPMNTTFTYNFDLLNMKGLKDTLVKVEKARPGKDGTVYTVQFIGLTDVDRKKIRLCCRDLWIGDQKEE